MNRTAKVVVAVVTVTKTNTMMIVIKSKSIYEKGELTIFYKEMIDDKLITSKIEKAGYSITDME